MADASKAHKLKLANSRKRFKELQELKKKKDATNTSVENDATEQTPVDSLTSSTHSSINNDINADSSVVQATPLPNYFNSSNNNYGDNWMFFDTISPKTNEKPSSSITKMVNNIVQTPQCDIEQPSEDNDYSLFNQSNQQSYVKETQQIIRPSTDSLTLEDPELKQNEIFEHHGKKSEGNPFSEQNRQDLIDFLHSGSQQVSDIENKAIKNEIARNSSKAIEGVQHSNTSSLSYFSNQMAQSHQPFETGSMSDLEKRNIELTTKLEQEKSLANQYQSKITDLESKITRLENEISSNDNSLELNRFSEELNCHTQTIRLLVSEKTELSANLTQLETNFKQKSSECEELQARLKNSRSRAFELEQELNNLKSDKIRKESSGVERNELFVHLQRDYDVLREQKDELSQDLLEVREKLRTTAEDKANLQKVNSELSTRLSLAEVKIQQLSSSGPHTVQAEFDKLVQEKSQLEREVATLNTMLKSITKERDESTAHYQHYTEELNSQLTTLQDQFQRLQQENENLLVQEQNRIRHIGDLERQMQSVQNDRAAFSTNFSDGSLKNDLEVTKELCVQLQMEKTELEENYTKTLNEKDMLLKELSAKNDSLSQLESMVEQLRGNQPDSVKLLATMESDKVAAARAVQQNKELKEQLESMQEVFAKMDNDKVELTEKLAFETSSNKDLLEKLQKTELQLQRLTDAIEIKDRELSLLRDSSAELNKQVLHQEQLADRLRHYEAHDNSSHSLQSELQDAKQTVVRLTNEINVLRNQKEHGIDDVDLRSRLDEMRLKNEELMTKLENHTETDNNNASESSKETKCERMLEKEEAMTRLEEKVKKTMQEIADLSDEKQRLEHLVLQLQSETETIGEYVALYQHQRMILKQKAEEKDEQLEQLATDREQIKAKLEKLNQLVERLIKEKPIEVGRDLLDQYQHNQDSQEPPLRLPDSTNIDGNAEAAEEILTLLSEIKSSNLVEPKESVHSCPYCSGQLLTV